MKAVAVLLLGVAVMIVSGTSIVSKEDNNINSINLDHNLKAGKRQSGDSLLNHTEIKRAGRWFWYDNYDFEYHHKDTLLTYIEVNDLVPDELGGYPSITKGGVDKDNVNIHLHSRWNKGFNFEIKIFGFL